MKSDSKLSETEVLLNFQEDVESKFLHQRGIIVEFPAGRWQGSRQRSIADIHGPNTVPIEAKPNFLDAKRDFLNPKKNQGIVSYIYSSDSITDDEVSFWKENNCCAAVYLTGEDKWCIIGKLGIGGSKTWHLENILREERRI